jgi:hypothetical protein
MPGNVGSLAYQCDSWPRIAFVGYLSSVSLHHYPILQTGKVGRAVRVIAAIPRATLVLTGTLEAWFAGECFLT